TGAVGEVAGDAQALRERLALREHEGDDLLAGERPRLVEDDALQIVVQREPPGLELTDHLLMAGVELVVQPEPRHRVRALLAVPGIGSEDAADVEKDVCDVHAVPSLRTERICHDTSARAAPSRPRQPAPCRPAHWAGWLEPPAMQIRRVAGLPGRG